MGTTSQERVAGLRAVKPEISHDEEGGSAATKEIPEERLSAGEVRRRAVTGAAVYVLRGFGVRFIGLLGLLVLARLLTPHDFGLVAFGLTLITFTTFLTDGGIGAALIRRSDPPSRADLKAILAFQLGLSTALAAVATSVLLPFGELGQVMAIMMLSLPVAGLRVPGMVLLERSLDYRPLAFVEIVETLFYFGWAIVTVSIGWGVFGLASASIVRAVVGSAAILYLVPSARLLPSPSWARVRTLLGFGLRYQAVGLAHMFREEGTNAAVLIFAGISSLGLWSLAYRILQLPLLLLNSLWRISYPGMSRLLAVDEDVAPTLERTLSTVAVAIGVILAPLAAASTPFVTVFFGDQWTDAAAVIPPACLHLMIAGPISVALTGYLWAVGDASAVLRATLAGIVCFAIGLGLLLPTIGVAAVGVAWLPCGVVESVIMVRAARTRVSVPIARPLGPPAVSAVLGAVAGWAAASTVGAAFAALVIGAGVALLVYCAALAAWRRRQLLDVVSLVSRGMRGAMATGS